MEDYDIITRLGGGSFADVYKAIDKNTGEYVAIKVLKEKYSKGEDCLTLREVKSMQKLH
jgi:serine/threonine protein kinase